ncbi:MAG: hypothetical protein ACR2LC_17795 [Pyrinomonadaceae bacterium]
MTQAIRKGFAVALLAFVIGSGATATYRKLYPQYRYTGISASLISPGGTILKTHDYKTPTSNILVLRITAHSDAEARESVANSLHNARLTEREILRDDKGKPIGERTVLVYQSAASPRPFTKVTLLKGSSMLVAFSYNSSELFVVEKMAVADFDF